MWNFYLIKKNNYTYAGVTVNTSRRLRQHNGIIKGGAKYTTSKGMGWDFVCIVSGFPNRKYAQQFEWANKHPICHGIKRRIDRLYEVLNMDKWTSKSEKSSLTPLQIKWFVEHHERSVPPHISDDL
tara:strand:- start:1828 stop:2205 length:378 start_codon:yes stop_codon:yes gene_type:complete